MILLPLQSGNAAKKIQIQAIAHSVLLVQKKKKYTPEELVEVKAKLKSRTCGQLCHWHSDRNPDVSLKSGVKLFKEE